MKITNPTDQDITVQIFGTTYTLEANGELSGIDRKVAEYWKKQLHGFLAIHEEDAEKLETIEIVKKDEEEEEEEGEVTEVEVDLVELKRAQLDELAEAEGLTPGDYKNKDELIEALLEKEE